MLRNQQYGEGIDFPIIKQREGNRYGKGIDFPIIKQSGGGRNKQRTVNFTTRSGKRISFKTSSVRRRQRRGKTRQQRQRGRGGVIPEYLTKEIGEIAGSVGRAAVAEGMSEGVNIAKKGIQFFKNKLLNRRGRKRTKKVVPISEGVPWVA